MSLFSFAADEEQQRAKTRLRNDASYVGALSIAVTLVMQYAFSFIMKLLIAFGVFSSDSISKPFLGLSNTEYLFLYAMVYVVSLAVPALLVSFLHKRRYVPFSPAKRISIPFAVLLVLSAVGMCMLSNIINSYISMFFREMGANVPPPPQLMVNTPVSFIINLIVIAVLPALLEEMIWRGYILRSFRAYGDGFAVLISAILFGMMHGNLRQIPFATIVGLFLGLLYVVSNNIWVPITVHFLNNSISVVIEYLSFSLSDSVMDYVYGYVIYGLILVGLLSALILLIAYRRKLRLSPNKSSLGFIGRYRVLLTTPLFLSAMLLYFVLILLEM